MMMCLKVPPPIKNKRKPYWNHHFFFPSHADAGIEVQPRQSGHPKRAIPHCFLEKKGDDSTQPLKGRKKRLDSLTIVGKWWKIWDIYSKSCLSVLSGWCTWGSGRNQISIVAALTGHKICRSPTKCNSSFTLNLYPSCAHLPPLEPRNKLQDTLACCVSASSARVESAALQGCLLWDWIHRSQAKPWYLMHQKQCNEPLPLGIHLVAPSLLQCTARVHECAQHPSHNTLTIPDEHRSIFFFDGFTHKPPGEVGPLANDTKCKSVAGIAIQLVSGFGIHQPLCLARF